MRSRAVLIGTVTAAAVVVVVGSMLRPNAPPSRGAAPELGHDAPAFQLSNLDGRKVSLKDSYGKPVLINFWATWCTPCRREMPLINREVMLHRAKFAILAVDEKEPASDVRDFARRLHLAFQPLLDRDGTVASAYRVGPMPESIWLDPSGIVRSIHFGPMNQADFASSLARANR